MTDEELAELRKKEKLAYEEYARARQKADDALKPLNSAWLDMLRNINREKTRRELLAEIAADQTGKGNTP